MTAPDRIRPPGQRRSFAGRFLGALRLDGTLFDEVEHDPRALRQAACVVVLGGIARGIASLGESGLQGLAVGVVSGLVIWLSTSAVVWAVGVRAFGYDADFPRVLRTLGFAAAPLVGLALCGIPLAFLVTAVWWIAHGLAIFAFLVAVEHALDTTPARALIVCVVAVALALVVLFLLGLLFASRTLSIDA